MLCQLGGVQFEIWPLNALEIGHDGAAAFAEKAVLGRRPPLEFVGEGPEIYRVRARLFPAKFGGLSSLAALSAQRRTGGAFPFMRGDGAALGWFVIEAINERSTYLDARGVGQVIEVEIVLRRSDQVAGSANIGSMLSLFA